MRWAALAREVPMTCFLCNRSKKTAGPLSMHTFGNTTVALCGECAGGIRTVEGVTEKLKRQASEQDGGDRS